MDREQILAGAADLIPELEELYKNQALLGRRIRFIVSILEEAKVPIPENPFANEWRRAAGRKGGIAKADKARERA